MKIVDNTILTPREKEIVLYILSGKNKCEIANLLFLSVSTIKTNVENIYRKFGVHNKASLIVYVIKNKIVEFDDSDFN
jgi:DNA-binding NarL/FixJ family response regulator